MLCNPAVPKTAAVTKSRVTIEVQLGQIFFLLDSVLDHYIIIFLYL